MNKKVKIFFIVGIVIVLASSSYFFFFNNSTAEEKVDYFKVEQNTDDSVLRATGAVVPEKTVEIKSSISEKILEVNFEEGENVNEDELILKYDNKLIKNDIENAEINKEKAELSLEEAEIAIEESHAALQLAETKLNNAKNYSLEILKEEIKQAEINLDDGEDKLDRYNYLYEKNAIENSKKEDQEYQVKLLKSKLRLAKQKLEDRKIENNNKIKEAEKNLLQTEKAYLGAKKKYELAKKSFEEAENMLVRRKKQNENYYIFSPLNGIILSKNIEEGEYVQTGQTLFRIASDKLLIKISPDERELALLKENKTAYIASQAYPNKKIKAKLLRISPEVDSERGTIDVYFEPVSTNSNLLPNMTVSVDIINDDMERKQKYIPADYLVNESSVYKYIDGKAKLIKVNVSNKNNNRIKIKDGLDSGDIILNPAQVKDGQEINIER